MIKLHNMLMIGAAESNVGKTELACELISRQSDLHDVIGIKVTTIREADGECPRGGEGCGVCSSFEGNFLITEEGTEPPGKDTVRMLAAGAKRVLWLRVLRAHLDEGISELLDKIDRDAVLICESNSLRQVLEPGLFIMVKDRSSDKYKPSAQDMKEYADRIVQYDGEKFDIDLDDISVVEGAWALKMDATAIIMAGGKGSRMGQEKYLLPVDGHPMIEHICNKLRPHFKQLLISANNADRFSFLGIDVVPDRFPDRGPLMGIASALEASVHDVNVVVACDMPDIDVAFVKRLLRESIGYEGVVPVTGTSRLEPMCAVYRKSILKTMNEALSSGDRKVSEVLRRCKIKYIEVSDAPWFRNINTMKDYEAYIASRNLQQGMRNEQ